MMRRATTTMLALLGAGCGARTLPLYDTAASAPSAATAPPDEPEPEPEPGDVRQPGPTCVHLTGRVVDEDGRGVSGATVYLHASPTGRPGSGDLDDTWGEVRAEQDGSFVLYDSGWTTGLDVWLVADRGGRRGAVDLNEPIGCSDVEVGKVTVR